jgi:hypothetical protein
MGRQVARSVCAGVAAGLAGAACMGLISIVVAALAGENWYFPLELIGGVATGSTARFDAGLQAGVAAMGVLAYLTTGAVWGAIFGGVCGFLMDDLSSKEFLIGVYFAILAWVVDLFIVMPHADPASAYAVPLWLGALLHLGYGAILGAVLPLLRDSVIRLQDAHPRSNSPGTLRRARPIAERVPGALMGGGATGRPRPTVRDDL